MDKIKVSKIKWATALSFYSLIILTIFILVLSYTQWFLHSNAMSATELDESYEYAVEIFWFNKFRILILIFLIILSIFFIVLFSTFKLKNKNLNKQNKIIMYSLFYVNAFLLFLSFIYISVLIQSVNGILWNLKHFYGKNKGLVDKKRHSITLLYERNIVLFEGLIFLSVSVFSIVSIFQIYHLGLILHKKYKPVK